jgi:hypothetical protein
MGDNKKPLIVHMHNCNIYGFHVYGEGIDVNAVKKDNSINPPLVQTLPAEGKMLTQDPKTGLFKAIPSQQKTAANAVVQPLQKQATVVETSAASSSTSTTNTSSTSMSAALLGEAIVQDFNKQNPPAVFPPSTKFPILIGGNSNLALVPSSSSATMIPTSVSMSRVAPTPRELPPSECYLNVACIMVGNILCSVEEVTIDLEKVYLKLLSVRDKDITSAKARFNISIPFKDIEIFFYSTDNPTMMLIAIKIHHDAAKAIVESLKLPSDLESSIALKPKSQYDHYKYIIFNPKKDPKNRLNQMVERIASEARIQDMRSTRYSYLNKIYATAMTSYTKIISQYKDAKATAPFTPVSGSSVPIVSRPDMVNHDARSSLTIHAGKAVPFVKLEDAELSSKGGRPKRPKVEPSLEEITNESTTSDESFVTHPSGVSTPEDKPKRGRPKESQAKETNVKGATEKKQFLVDMKKMIENSKKSLNEKGKKKLVVTVPILTARTRRGNSTETLKKESPVKSPKKTPIVTVTQKKSAVRTASTSKKEEADPSPRTSGRQRKTPIVLKEDPSKKTVAALKGRRLLVPGKAVTLKKRTP